MPYRTLAQHRAERGASVMLGVPSGETPPNGSAGGAGAGRARPKVNLV